MVGVAKLHEVGHELGNREGVDMERKRVGRSANLDVVSDVTIHPLVVKNLCPDVVERFAVRAEVVLEEIDLDASERVSLNPAGIDSVDGALAGRDHSGDDGGSGADSLHCLFLF